MRWFYGVLLLMVVFIGCEGRTTSYVLMQDTEVRQQVQDLGKGSLALAEELWKTNRRLKQLVRLVARRGGNRESHK